MPGEDRTGPLGQGPLTGRGLGPCGRGFRRGGGFGRGMRFWNRTRQTQQPSTEKQMLEEELKQLDEEENAMKNERESVRKRLEELSGENKK